MESWREISSRGMLVLSYFKGLTPFLCSESGTLSVRLRGDIFQRFSILSRKKEKCKRESGLFSDSGGERKTGAKRTGMSGGRTGKKHGPFRENRL
jgi:hypothetical protein